MPPCFCSFNPPSPSVSKFISDQPFLSMLETSCNTITDLKKIHAQIIKTGLAIDTIAASRLLSFCTNTPDLPYALSVFRRMEEPNLFSWNTIIRGFCRSSDPHLAISLFVEMLTTSPLHPSTLTYPSVFKAYTQLGLAKNGAQLHARIIKQGTEFKNDPFVRNSIIHMYASCGLLGDAWKLFDENQNLDVVSWNSMIMGLAKSGEIEESWRLFSKIPCRNEISWNSMISGFVRSGRWGEAFDVFYDMQEKQIRPTEFTLVSMLNACGRVGALEQGKWFHDYITRNGVDLNVIVVTAIIAIIDMYCKCGDIEMAYNVFKNLPRKGLSCWNSMMLGLASNGYHDRVFELFLELERSSLRPDYVTFIALLTASNHLEARKYFRLMRERYGMEARIEHYGCMVDVLGRSGLIEEAVEFITNMPMAPDAVIWGSLLAACNIHGNAVEVAELAARNLSLLDPNDTGASVLMSNVYAASGDFSRAVEERVKMEKKKKQPGCSLIQVNGEVHEFLASGNWHSQTET